MPTSPSRLDVLTFRLAAGIDPKLLQILYPDKFPAELSGADIEDGLGMGSGRDEGLAGVAQVEREEEGRVSSSSAGSLGVERPTSALLTAEATHHLPDALLRLPPLVPLPPASTPRFVLKRRLEADDDGDELDEPVVASDVRLRRDRDARDCSDPSTSVPGRSGQGGPYRRGFLSSREVALLSHHAELIISIGMQVADYVGITQDDLPRRTVPFLVRCLERLVKDNGFDLRGDQRARSVSSSAEDVGLAEEDGYEDEAIDDGEGEEIDLTRDASLSVEADFKLSNPTASSPGSSTPFIPSALGSNVPLLNVSFLPYRQKKKAKVVPWTEHDLQLLDHHIDAWAASDMQVKTYIRDILAADFPHRSIPALTTCMYTRKQARGISQQSRPRPAPNHSHPWSAEEKACLERHIDIWTASTSGLNMLKYVEQIAAKDFPERKLKSVYAAMWNRVRARGVVQIGAGGGSGPTPSR